MEVPLSEMEKTIVQLDGGARVGEIRSSVLDEFRCLLASVFK